MTESISFKLRLRYLFLFILLIFAFIIFRLFYLQIIKKDFYTNIIKNQHSFLKVLEPERGSIFMQDKFGQFYPLAINKNWPILYIIPQNIKNIDKNLISKLSEILKISKNELEKKFKKENDYYEIIAKKIDDETFEKIKNLNSKDLYFEKEQGRIYPYNNLTSHVLGFLGKKENYQIGQYGIEEYFEENLRGEKGVFEGEKDVQGRWIAFGKSNIKPAVNGSSLILTIDKNIQFIAEEKLQNVIQKWQADSGSIIVMETKTGKILAMANYPNFNPNEYYKVKDLSIFKNQVIQTVFEPGSVFKPIIMAAGLDTEVITPQTKFYDEGFIKIGDRIIKTFDQKHRGWQTMSQVIEQSLNTGMVFIAQKLGKDNFRNYVNKFGFGKKIGITLSGEISGDISNLNKKEDIYFATASFGQGISVTPIQMITAINAIANKGLLVKPYIVEKEIKSNNEVVEFQPVSLGQIIKPDTANKITEMMINAIEKGYEHRGGVDGYLIAGKTGTAQVPNPNKKGYSNKFIHSFVGFGPAYNPKFTAFIKIDNPKGISFAANSLSPTFGELAKYILNYYEIKPDIK